MKPDAATKPAETEQLAGRKPLDPDTADSYTEADVAVFELPEGAQAELVRDETSANTYRVHVRGRGDGIHVAGGPRVAEHVKLDRRALESFRHVTEIEGSRPSQAAVRFQPELHKRPPRPRRGEDRPINVFGADDRRLFGDTSFPWRTSGRIWTAAGAAAGCTIGSRLVLTASHCVDWDDDGGAGWIKFSPGYNGGNGPWGEFYATQIISWNKAEGPLSDLETAFDYVVLVMNAPVGDMVGWPGYRAYDSAWNGGRYWQHVGYPGDLAGTLQPSFQGDCVISSAAGHNLGGQAGLVLGHFNDTTPGHSGGPVWGWWDAEEWPRVVGVCSAEASTPGPTTKGDNEFGGGPALSALIGWARSNYP